VTTLREAAQQALEALLDDPNKLVQISEHHWEGKRDLAVIALRAAIAEPVKAVNKTPAWWMDGLAATLMREGVNKHRAKEIAKGYWEAYCQVPMDEEQPR
jgi:hypothetical protein